MHRKQGKCLRRHLGLVYARFVGPGEDCQDLGKKWACTCHSMTIQLFQVRYTVDIDGCCQAFVCGKWIGHLEDVRGKEMYGTFILVLIELVAMFNELLAQIAAHNVRSGITISNTSAKK